MKGHLDAEQLKSMDYKSLQNLAKDMGVSAAGKTEDIIARIAAVEVDVPGENELMEKEKAAAEAARQEEERAAAEKAAREQADAAQAAEKKAREEAEKAAEAARQEEERVAAEKAAREQAEAAQAAEKKAREEAEKLVKVKAVTRFLDKQLNQIKDAGEAYSVSRERAAELTAAGVAEIAE